MSAEPSAAVFVLEAHGIFRQGLVSCLSAADGVGSVEEASSVAAAWDNPALGEADVALVDIDLDGAVDFVRELDGFAGIPVLAIAGGHDDERVAAAASAGAFGALDRARLTPRSVVLAVLTAVEGGAVLFGAPQPGQRVAQPAASAEPSGPLVLKDREREVLALIVDGLPTRQVATELSYSERTIKKILSDVVVKLGARSRSQAIATAVRQGLV